MAAGPGRHAPDHHRGADACARSRGGGGDGRAGAGPNGRDLARARRRRAEPARLDPAAGVTCVVVWSAGWDKPTWDSIKQASLDAGPEAHTMVILTRPQHHQAW